MALYLKGREEGGSRELDKQVCPLLRNIARVLVMFEIWPDINDFQEECSTFEALRNSVLIFSPQKSQNVFHNCCQVHEKIKAARRKVAQYKDSRTVDDFPEHGKVRVSTSQE